jgi:hypothetical protein
VLYEASCGLSSRSTIPAVINTGGDHFVTLARLCPQVYSDIVRVLRLPRCLALDQSLPLILFLG